VATETPARSATIFIVGRRLLAALPPAVFVAVTTQE
jgi:hypothetical protein